MSPRRFGKSLFRDTLNELHEGNRALFIGLYAEDHWDRSARHPVLRLRFGSGVLRASETLAASLHEQLLDFEKAFSRPAELPSARGMLKQSIRNQHDRTGVKSQDVV
ncbi:MAG: AAA family ATPase [Candidatus Sericytochromatia bacterium]|nr:AAA family ATPase [Candidatus Sericytochromatia bacterium]